jgi:hypothetical protein
MQQLQISHSADLQKLQDDGYVVEISGGKYLLAHHIPYVDDQKLVKYGTLVCILNLAGSIRLSPPSDHTIYFQGDTPCDLNGVALSAIINNSVAQRLTESIEVNHYFSSKPVSGKYETYFDKVRTYSEILLAQALAIDLNVTCRPNRKTKHHEDTI